MLKILSILVVQVLLVSLGYSIYTHNTNLAYITLLFILVIIPLGFIVRSEVKWKKLANCIYYSKIYISIKVYYLGSTL